MLHLSVGYQYFFYNHPADMRKGFDGLSGLVTNEMLLRAVSGAVFIFLNKKRNQVKLLLFEGDGFAVYYKRLEKGTYEIPHSNSATNMAVTISAQQLQFILQGVSLTKIHFRPRYKKTG